MKVKSLSRTRLLETPWAGAYQAPPPMGFSRKEYWSGVLLPSPNMLSRLVITFFQKTIYFFTGYSKAFDSVDHNKLWKILKEMIIPVHLTYLLRNLYAGQEATVRTGHVTTDWFQIGKRSMSRLYIFTLLI